MSEKNAFTNQYRDQATAVAQARSVCEAMIKVYYNRGYNTGGSDQITDEDIAATNITAAELANMVTFSEQLVNMLDNQAVTQSNYQATLDVLRNDL